MPPPTPSTALPWPSNSTVRIATFSSHPAIGEANPTVPQYTPRRCGSQPLSSWRARSFGVPVTDAGGKVASSTAAIGTSTSTRAVTVDTRCHTPGAGRTDQQFGHRHTAGDRDPAKIVADKVDDHDVLCDVLDRCPQGCRIRVPRQRALDRTRGHRVAAPPQKQLRRQRCDRTPIAGQVCGPGGGGARHRVSEEIDWAPRRSGRRTACTHTPGRPRPPRSPPGRTAHLGGVLRDRPCPRQPRLSGVPQVRRSLRRPIREALHRKGFRTTTGRRPSWRNTQSDQPPAASGMRGPRPSAAASGYDR